MKAALAGLALCAATADGFRPQVRMGIENAPIGERVRAALKSAALAAALSGGAAMAPIAEAPAIAAPAGAGKLNAGSASGTRVNKDADSLLRYALPIQNKEVRELQASVEDVKGQIAIRQWSSGLSDVSKSKSVLGSKTAKILASVPSARQDMAKKTLAELSETLDKLQTELETDGSGEVKGDAKLRNSYKLQDAAAKQVGAIEEMMVPVDYHVSVPSDYKGLPYLDGRAEVQFTFKKAEKGEKFDVDGNLYDQVTLRMVVDGYTAPVTAGNFVELVSKGFYQGMAISRSDGFVVQTGEPKDSTAETNGYIPPGETTARRIPLEISLAQDKEPFYSLTVDEDGRGGQATKMPFQSTGALGMARAEFENDSASSQFFWLLFESDLTPAGKNMMDGRYACFGYTVEGADFLKDIKEGDVVTTAKVLSGLDNLKK